MNKTEVYSNKPFEVNTQQYENKCRAAVEGQSVEKISILASNINHTQPNGVCKQFYFLINKTISKVKNLIRSFFSPIDVMNQKYEIFKGINPKKCDYWNDIILTRRNIDSCKIGLNLSKVLPMNLKIPRSHFDRILCIDYQRYMKLHVFEVDAEYHFLRLEKKVDDCNNDKTLFIIAYSDNNYKSEVSSLPAKDNFWFNRFWSTKGVFYPSKTLPTSLAKYIKMDNACYYIMTQREANNLRNCAKVSTRLMSVIQGNSIK